MSRRNKQKNERYAHKSCHNFINALFHNTGRRRSGCSDRVGTDGLSRPACCSAQGDATEIERLVRAGAPIDTRDSRARTPLHVATYMQKRDAARALMRLGADPNALESQQYDI